MTSIQFLTNPIDLPHLILPSTEDEHRHNHHHHHHSHPHPQLNHHQSEPQQQLRSQHHQNSNISSSSILTSPEESPGQSPSLSSSSISPSPVGDNNDSHNNNNNNNNHEVDQRSSLHHQRKKRKQRSGPSCDHCRSRKVKCDANILILDFEDLTPQEMNFFSKKESKYPLIGFDYQNNPIYKIPNTDWKMVRTQLDNSVTNTKKNPQGCFKYIKYKNCQNCLNKHLDCKFSKGFTRIHSVALTTNRHKSI